MGPKTKAECDREIARLEHTLGMRKVDLERYKMQKQEACVSSCKQSIEQTKARIAELKALRKTLK